jgi:type VI protein secretion system component Hcp
MLDTRRTLMTAAPDAGSPVPTSGPGSVTAAEPAAPAQPGPTFFLDLATIPGSATAKGFAHQIPLITWGWGVDSSTSVLAGAGGGSGKPTPQDVVLRARTGPQSPKVLTAVNTGKHLPTALLTCVRPGNRPFTFMTLLFEDVLLTGYYVTPDATDGVPIDLVHLKFAKLTQKFFIQNPDGTSGQPVVSSFDYKTNTAGP